MVWVNNIGRCVIIAGRQQCYLFYLPNFASGGSISVSVSVYSLSVPAQLPMLGHTAWTLERTRQPPGPGPALRLGRELNVTTMLHPVSLRQTRPPQFWIPQPQRGRKGFRVITLLRRHQFPVISSVLSCLSALYNCTHTEHFTANTTK